ncbi:MAG: tubulin/FtsZ family protein [Halorientalis sp.]
MKLGLIGVGQAGGKIVEALMAYEANSRASFIVEAIAVNSAKADLLGLERVPLDNRILIGQSRVKGHGAGADNELGAELAQEDIDEIRGAVDEMPTHEIDAFLVIAGLGGGTGSGGAPVIAREINRVYTEPVYGLGALPGQDEGGIYTLNAARSIQTFVRETDNLILVDNDGWRNGGESLGAGYKAINDDIARRLGILFSAGETDDEDAVAESVVDASEIINTLGTGGITTIGYSTSHIERAKSGFLSRLSGSKPEPIDTQNQIVSTVRMAALGRLTLPCEITSAERALIVIAGPPAYLDRKGFERSRKWLEEATGTMEVRGGDYPVPDSEYLAAVVVLSGVSNVPRIKQLQQVAVETQQSMRDISDESDAALTDLTWSGDGDIEPLF